MTIGSTTNRNDYVADGATSVYSYTFKIEAATDILVTTRDLSNNEVTLNNITDYTVSGIGSSTGGLITLVAGNLTVGFIITIRRFKSFLQNTSIRNQGPFYPSTIEDTFDRLVMYNQQNQEELNRAMKLSETHSVNDFNPAIPAAINTPNIVLATDPTGKFWVPGPTIGAISGAAASATAAANSATSAAASAAAADTSVGINSPYGINNMGFAISSASNALTIALKQSDGNTDPASGSGAVIIVFHDPTTIGGTIQATTTSALSIVLPAGATLGLNNSIEDFIYIYGYKYVISGLLELAVSASNHWEDGVSINTTILNGSSTDAATMYSTTARSGVKPRLLARIRINNTTAGQYVLGLQSDSNVQFFDVIRKEKNIFARSANFTAKHGNVYLVDTSAARNIQLPVPQYGWEATFIDSTGAAGANFITFLRNGSEKINLTAANFPWGYPYGNITLTSNGTDYFIKQGNSYALGEWIMNGVIATSSSTFTIPIVSNRFNDGGIITTSSNNFLFSQIGTYEFFYLSGNAFGDGTTGGSVAMEIKNNTSSAILFASNGVTSSTLPATAAAGNNVIFQGNFKIGTSDLGQNIILFANKSGGAANITIGQGIMAIRKVA